MSIIIVGVGSADFSGTPTLHNRCAPLCCARMFQHSEAQWNITRAYCNTVVPARIFLTHVYATRA
jgi:hypothetical protein